VRIPTIEELANSLRKASTLAQKVEDGMAVPHQEVLAYLATDMEAIQKVDFSKLSLNPLLSTFIEGSLLISLKNYEYAKRRLVSDMDTTDIKSIQKTFDSLDKEMTTQINLLLQLATSVETYSDIRDMMKVFRHK
jgi:hypothetical protein